MDSKDAKSLPSILVIDFGIAKSAQVTNLANMHIFDVVCKTVEYAEAVAQRIYHQSKRDWTKLRLDECKQKTSSHNQAIGVSGVLMLIFELIKV